MTTRREFLQQSGAAALALLGWNLIEPPKKEVLFETEVEVGSTLLDPSGVVQIQQAHDPTISELEFSYYEREFCGMHTVMARAECQIDGTLYGVMDLFDFAALFDAKDGMESIQRRFPRVARVAMKRKVRELQAA